MNEQQIKQDWAAYLVGHINEDARAHLDESLQETSSTASVTGDGEIVLTATRYLTPEDLEQVLRLSGLQPSIEDFLKLQARRGKIDGVPGDLPESGWAQALHIAETGQDPMTATLIGTKAFGIDDIAAIFTAIKSIYDIIQKWRGKE